MKYPACLAALRKALRICGFLLATALITPHAFAGINRWTTSGPLGYYLSVDALAIDPTNPDRVYAGTSDGIYRTQDGGRTWATLLSVSASGLTIDPTNSSIVYAATSYGVLRSVDAGATWAPVGPPTTFPLAHSLAIDQANPDTVLAGTEDGVFKSNDRGVHWSGRLLALSIYSLVVSPQPSSAIFGADFDEDYFHSFPSSLYTSTDGGATWTNTNTGFVINPGTLAIDPTRPSTLYAGSSDGVIKSVDSGSTWRLGSEIGSVRALVLDPSNPLTLYAATFFAVFRSTDGGVTWDLFGDRYLFDLHASSLAIDSSGTRLYAGTSDGVFTYRIAPGPLGPQDVSVATDGGTRVPFTDLDGRAVFRTFDNSGNSSADGPHGPYRGWRVRAVADGADDLTRVLWNHQDGSAALWLLGPAGNQASYRFGPAAGWTAVDVSAAGGHTSHILWTSSDGRTAVTEVTPSGALVGNTTYGPFYGWTAQSISDGADGLTRLLWSHTDGRVGLSLIDAGQIVATHRFAPGPGWEALDVAVASDNQARILFVNADGRMAVWSVDNSGAVRNSGTVYGPSPSGQVAARVSAGADGLTRVLWTSPDGNGSVSLMGSDNVLRRSFGFCGDFGESSGCGTWDF